MREEPVSTILWRRLDTAGHEVASLEDTVSGPRLCGTSIFLHDGEPCHLNYAIDCDREWRTRAATVRGRVGRRGIDFEFSVAPRGTWTMNGSPVPSVTGCIDLDLNFSPSTNRLPIRRLELAIGKSAPVSAAWLRFPSFQLERLDQTYFRNAENTYRYESHDGEFTADLTVNEHGFVTDYAGLWQAEAGT